jgi:hypothetical protein
MERLNLVEIETRLGFRTFELYCGDITRLEPKVDILAVSSFARGYSPVPSTVFGALQENCGISVKALAQKCEFDFRDSLGCWVAKIDCPEGPAERLLCVEMVGTDFPVAEIIQNLFIVMSVLEMKEIPSASLALPILGAGMQGLDPVEVINELLSASLNYLERSRSLTKVQFVEFNEERARQLDKAMNQFLGRVRVVLPKGELMVGVRKDIVVTLQRAQIVAGGQARDLFNNLSRLIASDQSRSFEIGIIARRLVEFVCDDILRNQTNVELRQKIFRLYALNIADWIISYMHVLRIFGNESAHERRNSDRKPPVVGEADLALCLFCIHRLVNFWLEYRESEASMPSVVPGRDSR